MLILKPENTMSSFMYYKASLFPLFLIKPNNIMTFFIIKPNNVKISFINYKAQRLRLSII